MPSIPVDVFKHILENVDRADLTKLCLLNKICCSCAQDVLYREIDQETTLTNVCRTLARSTHLAKRVRSFETDLEDPSLAKALRNMSSLRRLGLGLLFPKSPTLLEGCTFKLDSLSVSLPFDGSLRKFLNSQPSLTCLSFTYHKGCRFPLEETCLPNITRLAWLLDFGAILAPLTSIFPSLTHLKLSIFFDLLDNSKVRKSF
jgi:hypothetical protein